MKNRNEGADNLGSLVKDELAAIETYKQALEKVAGKEAVGPELRRLEAEHEEALGVLQEHMTELDAEIRGIISSQLLPKTKAHIPVLDRLLAKAGS